MRGALTCHRHFHGHHVFGPLKGRLRLHPSSREGKNSCVFAQKKWCKLSVSLSLRLFVCLQVQLQLLTAIVKLFLKKPTETQELVQQVLSLATQVGTSFSGLCRPPPAVGTVWECCACDRRHIIGG